MRGFLGWWLAWTVGLIVLFKVLTGSSISSAAVVLLALTATVMQNWLGKLAHFARGMSLYRIPSASIVPEFLKSIALPHMTVLAGRRIGLTRADHYGVVHDDGWSDEISYFIENVVQPQLSLRQRQTLQDTGVSHSFRRWIDGEAARRASVDFPSLDKVDVGSLSPNEFETWCAKELRNFGWSANLTPSGADQGADVIATKGGLSVAIQCKLYSSPVGNKAVQEVFASARHYGVSHAAVVTNSDFTRSARVLAASTNVALLHFSELDRLGAKFGQSYVDGDVTAKARS